MPFSWVRSSDGSAAAAARLLGGGSRLRRLVVVLHQALPVALGGEAGLHGPRPHVGGRRHVGIVERASQLRLVLLGEGRVGRDTRRGEGRGRLGPDAHQLGQVVGLGLGGRGSDSRNRGSLRHRRRGLLRSRRGRLLGLELVVRDDLFAAQRLDGGLHQGLQRRGLLGRQRAVEQQGVLVGDRLLDEPDRVLPAALVQDEQGALLLLDLLADRAHELVVDPGVVDPAAQAAEDAAGRAHRDGAGGSGDDRPGDHAERADAGTALERAPVGRLVDADPAEPAPVHDRRVDDLHVVVGLVDALDRLQEASRGGVIFDGERRQGRVGLLVVAHGLLVSLVRRCRIGERHSHRTPRSQPGTWGTDGDVRWLAVPRSHGAPAVIYDRVAPLAGH